MIKPILLNLRRHYCNYLIKKFPQQINANKISSNFSQLYQLQVQQQQCIYYSLFHFQRNACVGGVGVNGGGRLHLLFRRDGGNNLEQVNKKHNNLFSKVSVEKSLTYNNRQNKFFSNKFNLITRHLSTDTVLNSNKSKMVIYI